jgi:hypothetical protein
MTMPCGVGLLFTASSHIGLHLQFIPYERVHKDARSSLVVQYTRNLVQQGAQVCGLVHGEKHRDKGGEHDR